jgi:hypothetical protein
MNFFERVKSRYAELKATREETLYEFLRWAEGVFKPEEGLDFLRFACRKFVNERLSDKLAKKG